MAQAGYHSTGLDLSKVNPELLRSMMDCVDTSLFSSVQLANWTQMKARLTSAVEHKTPVSLSTSDLVMVKKEIVRSEDFIQPLHREASIQDVLACLLDQQPPSARMMSSQSTGGSFLVHSENAKQDADSKPSLKKLLSSSDFSMTEKKESLRHLLSFIDTSFASNTPEPLTQVYKDCKAGTLQRLSSLQLMRNFIAPSPQQPEGTATSGGMGMRTTSFEIIQAMLNATSNQAIQKPMTSQDSFRFQHLARTLESIETDVSAIDNDDYGGDDVVQVDNLDHLLDYHGSNTSGMAAAPTATSSGVVTPGQSVGFVDTHTLVHPSRNIYTELTFPSSNLSTWLPYAQPMDEHQDYNPTVSTPASLPTMGIANHPSTLSYQHDHHRQQHMLQHQLLRQEPQQKQQQQYTQLYHHAMSQHQQQHNGLMLPTLGDAGANPPMPQFPPTLMQPGIAMHSQKPQQARSGNRPHPMRVATQNGKPIKTDATGTPLCSALGCYHAARVKGMCKLHGGGRRCKVDGCMKSAQTGHLCIAHGGGKPCHVEGCPKTAQSRGLCKQHGGGVRCKFEGCTKSCQSGGFCRGHGGGKRCEFPNCTKWAQKNGHCAKHAQELAAQQLQQQQAMQAQMFQQLVHP